MATVNVLLLGRGRSSFAAVWAGLYPGRVGHGSFLSADLLDRESSRLGLAGVVEWGHRVPVDRALLDDFLASAARAEHVIVARVEWEG